MENVWVTSEKMERGKDRITKGEERGQSVKDPKKTKINKTK